MTTKVDPVSRYIHLTYQVPADAPEEVVVLCSWSPVGRKDWRAAPVTPYVSDTALRLTEDKQWREWMERGRFLERRAAGLDRTVVFYPYPDAEDQGKVDVEFRIQIQSLEGKELSTQQVRVQADNSDVLYIEDWSKVFQRESVVSEAKVGERKWSFRTKLDPSAGVTNGNALYGRYTDDLPLPQLTYPLNLRGWYAIFLRSVAHGGAMRLRLSGDERTDTLGSRHPGEEVFWRWGRMDRQQLVLKQPHYYTGYSLGHIDYVRLVPLAEEQVRQLDKEFTGKNKKLVAGYFEPYSWAFVDNVQETLQHREPLTSFADAGIKIVDIQLGRFGSQMNYETQVADQLLSSTIGDPIDGVIPTTPNVGKMQQFTNMLDAELRYTRELGMIPHANFGATNCYPGTPMEGQIAKQHPEWVRNGWALRYEVPEVQQHILSLYREALEVGAPGVSIDFCRYPEGIDTAETCNQFLRSLKKLRDEFSRLRKKPVPLLIRFPAKGVRLWKNFDYPTWIREHLVDYLCPSNIQGRHLHFDIAPYVQAVRGTPCKLLPVVDGLWWGPEMPGMFLWRVKQLYDSGADGIYIYQADGRVLNRPDDLRCVRHLASRAAVDRWWKQDAQERPRRSKGIHVTFIGEDGEWHYNSYARLRVWLEGIPLGEVELYLDGKLLNRYAGPPYVLGSEEYETDKIVPPGKHELKVRAKDGDGWLQQTFTIYGVG